MKFSINLFLISAIILFFNSESFCQPPIEWQKCLGGTGDDESYTVRQTTDSGYIVIGVSYSNDDDVNGNHGNGDIWAIKLNRSGNIVWQKCLGGSNFEESNSVVLTADKGFLLGGLTNSSDGDIKQTNLGGMDYWLIKLDSTGNITWENTYGGGSGDQAFSIKQTIDSGYIIAGNTNSSGIDVQGNHGYVDYWVLKIDANGNIQWQKCLGGSQFDWGRSISQTFDGGFIVAGYTNSKDLQVVGEHDTDTYHYDGWVVKLNDTGSIQWAKCIGGTLSDVLYSIVQMPDSNYIAVGGSNSQDGDIKNPKGLNDVLAVKLNPDGNIQWVKNFGGSDFDEAYSINPTTDGNFIIAAGSQSNDGDVTGNHGGEDEWIFKMDANGNILWQKCMGGTGQETATDMEETNDGGFIITGTTLSHDGEVAGEHDTSALNADYWVVKLGPDIVTSDKQYLTPSAFNIYPNPANSRLTLSGYDAKNCAVQITDITGRIILRVKTINDYSTALNIKGFPCGLYFLSITDKDGNMQVKKFTVE